TQRVVYKDAEFANVKLGTLSGLKRAAGARIQKGCPGVLQSTQEMGPAFVELLQKNKKTLLEQWFQRILATYPDDTARFYAQKKDPFANPVGNTLHKEIDAIFDELLLEQSSEQLPAAVDAIVRVRAVQDYTASAAVSFFLLLKEIVRETIGQEALDTEQYLDLLAFEGRIDQLCLLAFDTYMQCREKIWSMKANEVQQRTKNLLRQADIVWTVPENGPESGGGHP
ncbi:MAG: RsbRD N-terminal domain-containing protein, partial [Thermodesulfobacteriota bacterium]